VAQTDRPWWVDDARVRSDADALDRAPFAARAATLIREFAADESSTVVGLVGGWGSGKTTTINFIVQDLRGSGVQVREFNPWALTGADAVVGELLASIGSAMPRSSKGRQARKRLKQYRVYLAPLLALVPVVGGTASQLAMAHASRKGTSTVYEQMAEVGGSLQELRQPVLVVIDDVDRLQPDELLTLFKAVRLLGRLPYVHYLLAYDEHTVLGVVAATPVAAGSTPRALAFLEKIVTLRLDQPPTRPEHAARLFGEGLAAALAGSGAVLTADQQRRLADEQGALLGRALREPRAILRFHAQLQTYLPLVGANEIDVVDFAILTYLRAARPLVYQRLRDDQVLLTSGATTVEEEQRQDQWRDGSVLRGVEEDETDRARLLAAIRRLFPRIDPDQTHAAFAEADSRRAARRVSSPDHVARYFALVPPDEDVRDRDLLAAMDAWAGGDPDAAPRVREVLRPDPSTTAACERAARVLRRAETYSGRYDPGQAAALLSFAVRLLPLPDRPGAGQSPEAAWVQWATTLIGGADLTGEQKGRDIGEWASVRVGVLLPLLRALSLAVDERRAAQRSDGDRSLTLEVLVEIFERFAWKAVLANVRQGDDAPDEPVDGMLSWLDERLGPIEVNRRLHAEFEKGLDVLDFAARLVSIGSHPASGTRSIVGFNADSATLRIGAERVARNLPSNNPPTTDAHSEDDISWRNRRAIATRLLAARVAEAPARTTPRLPAARQSPGPLQNHQPALLREAEDPDLSIRLTVLAPPDRLPAVGSVATGPEADAREQAVQDLLQRSPLTNWLGAVAPRWNAAAPPAPWKVIDTDGRTRTVVHTGLDVSDPAATSWRQQRPVSAAAQIWTGLADGGDSPQLVLSVQVGIWLVELDEQRRPASVRSNTEPFAAALSVPEVHELLVALFSTVPTAQRAADVLLDTAAPDRLLVDVSVDGSAGLSALVDVRDLRREPAVGGGHVRATYDVATTSLAGGRAGQTPRPAELAAAVLKEWLLQAGVRGYETMLVELTGSPNL
jgi:hypothetical protein